MRETHLGFPWQVFVLMSLLYSATLFATVHSQPSSENDATVMQQLKKNLNPPSSLGWDDPDPCNWKPQVQCSQTDNRVTHIQIGNLGLTGSLPMNLNNLTSLQVFEVYGNNLSGPLPSLSGLGLLQRVMVRDNNFSYMPPDFFDGMTSLRSVILDYNSFAPWAIPDSIKNSFSLSEFSATSTNITGPIPEFFGNALPGLTTLRLAFNNLEGGLPASFAGCSLQQLWLNGKAGGSKLNGSIAVIKNMTELTEIWLHMNSFSGPLPDFSALKHLQNVSLRDNQFTGPVPESLVSLPSLIMVNLSNNLLQGKTPNFSASVKVDMVGANSFCLSIPGVGCDPKVDSLLAVVQDMGYPTEFASNWKGNDPCAGQWMGITCLKGDIIVVNFDSKKLTGTISPNFSSIGTLQKLILANNNLTGTIPEQLTSLPSLQVLDVSNNQLYGKVPQFARNNVLVKTEGNANIGKDGPPPNVPATTPSGSPSSSDGGKRGAPESGKKSSTGVIVGSVVGVGATIVFAGMLVFFIRRTKSRDSSRVQGPSTMVIHPRHSGSDQDTVKITIAGSSVGGAASENYSNGSNEPRDIHIVESNGLKIQIEVLKKVTNNFSEDNILGKGGFGTVYKGELDDGTKIAVKRMESGVLTDKGLVEFQSEIAVVTKVRHRHLVALLGFCLDAGERILVYEYMPQGALSRHLFDWKHEQLRPLDWMKRLIIALDVARGVEYLHSLAQQSFIHRDLKPSNILLGDDMRAKVADFGLVRLVPEGKGTVVTRLAGTFGYLAPEYAVMGRVTTKLDVFSFGVILMELITGRKALDETMPEESAHLVTWFRRMQISKELRKAIDPAIELDEETLASVNIVAELAGHCCAREPHQRPDMSHAVNVLSSLTEKWKPAETDPDELYGIDYDMTLPQAVKKWQALEGMSSVESTSYFGSNDNTQTSIPTRPSGFADSFTSSDGR